MGHPYEPLSYSMTHLWRDVGPPRAPKCAIMKLLVEEIIWHGWLNVESSGHQVHGVQVCLFHHEGLSLSLSKNAGCGDPFHQSLEGCEPCCMPETWYSHELLEACLFAMLWAPQRPSKLCHDLCGIWRVTSLGVPTLCAMPVLLVSAMLPMSSAIKLECAYFMWGGWEAMPI